MSTAYPQHIHTVMFTITLPCTLALLFIYAFLFTIWYFFTITAQLTLQQCLQHILNIYIQYCLQLLSPVYLLCCLHMLSFSQCEYFLHITVQLSIWQCLHWIFTVTYSIVYNYSSQYTNCAVYICFPFHNVIFFHNHCPINSTTMFTAYPQHIHTVLFTITLPQYTDFAFTYAILFTIWYFFTITAQLTLQQCLQHILNIYLWYCLQLHCPVYWLCCLYMLPLHNVTFFHNYCTIDSTTMSTAYPQHIHIVLFATTLQS